jgi:hypothetical protein
MLINVLNFFMLLAVLAVIILPFFIKKKGEKRTIKIPKNHNDTSGARYAINEKGFLEEIQQDKFSRHAH